MTIDSPGRETRRGHADPSFPVLHGRPETGWLNDPNGLAHVDGVWHVFFQHNPAGPQHADIHWGHASSTDLITWTHEPIALRPTPDGHDSVGCWTGCVTDQDGTPTAVYTGVGAGGASEAVTLVATSDRSLRTWTQEPAAVGFPPADSSIQDVRDPYVFTHDGHRYAVLGAGHPRGRGQVLLYRCDDLRNWEFLGPLLTSDDPVAAQHAAANIWECPNLVPFGDEWLLVVSLWHFRDGAHELDGVSWLLGSLETTDTGLRFVPRTGGAVDGGPTFYAPQLLRSQDRVLLWGWSREDDRDSADVEASGWSGVLTFPRELSVVDGELHSRPAPELLGLRRSELPGVRPLELDERSFEVVSAGPADLALEFPGAEPVVVAEFGDVGEARVFVDGSLIEIFENGTARTLRAYPTPGALWRVRGAGWVYRLGTP